nr:MAG TPA: DNA polymerase family B [Caudoviricetes sp.]
MIGFVNYFLALLLCSICTLGIRNWFDNRGE